jgi:hypothetical protein
MNREAIYSALVALLEDATGEWRTTSRRLEHWNDVPPEAQPALFQSQTGEFAVTVRGQPTVWTLNVDVYVYCFDSSGKPPAPALNDLIDSIQAALEPNAVEEAQTLGGLVHWCRIDGQIETDEGTLGSQAVAIVPISILVS